MRRRPADPPRVRKLTPQNGFAIREFREREGVSIEQMANWVDRSVAHVRNIELEYKAARPEQIALIAQRLRLPIAAIVRGTSATDRPEEPAEATDDAAAEETA